MQAVVQSTYGDPDVLELQTVPLPRPASGQVCIRVHATTATAADGMMRTGRPLVGRLYTGLLQPARPIPGVEFAGEVVEIGDGVQGFAIGDRVFGETADMGCYAQFVCVDASGMLAPIPSNLSYEQAAPVCGGGSTAVNFLRDLAAVEPGQSVLVYGASGSVGMAAVQIARAYGARVTGVCSARNLALVRAQGAHHVIDYTSEDFAQSGEQYDVIFDAVGKLSFSACRGALTERGAYLSAVLSLPLLLQVIWTWLRGGQRALFSATGARPLSRRIAYLQELTTLLETGELTSFIDRRFTLSDMPHAHRYVATGRKRGNVVISLA